MDSTFFTQATGCTTLECGVKDSLSESRERPSSRSGLTHSLLGATNLTMSTCQVPQASQAEIAPILAATLGMLTLMMVILRVIQRTVINRNFGWDDGLIVVALCIIIPMNCMMFPSEPVNNP